MANFEGDNPTDAAFVRAQYVDAGSGQTFNFPIVPVGTVTTIGGAVGPVVTIASGTSGFDLIGSSSTLTFTGPLTTKGDLYAFSSTGIRLPVGTNGQVLTADSTQTSGLKWVTPSASGYSTYVALLSQTGTSDPVATVLANSLGGTVVWTRTAAGAYLGTLAGAFTASKTVILVTGDTNTVMGFSSVYGASRASVNTVTLGTYSIVEGAQEDDLMAGTTIEIRVYA